jgi:hypothetical protein
VSYATDLLDEVIRLKADRDALRAAIQAECDKAEADSNRFEHTLPVPTWVTRLRAVLAIAGADREYTEQPDEYEAHISHERPSAATAAAIERIASQRVTVPNVKPQFEDDEVGDTGQAEEPQREWHDRSLEGHFPAAKYEIERTADGWDVYSLDVEAGGWGRPRLTEPPAGQVVPQHDEQCERDALRQSHGLRMCRCALRAGLIPGPVGQDTTGGQQQ